MPALGRPSYFTIEMTGFSKVVLEAEAIGGLQLSATL